MGRDVIQPAATAVESGERGRDDAIAFNTDDAQSRVARHHRGERCIVVTRPIADAARAPERAKRIAIARSKIADLHCRPY